jgi:phospho-N-acetylmuramoyl-pentapeptide-transferase
MNLSFIRIIASFLVAYLISMVAIPKFIPALHRLKFGQIQREDGMATHKSKSGTPTMGGVVIILATILAVYIVRPATVLDPYVFLLVFALVGNGAVGLLDDYLIVIRKTNKGLAALHKFLLQSAMAILFYLLVLVLLPNFTTTLNLFNQTFELGFLYPVLVYFMFTAATNGVNLSDGLDGLATGLVMMSIAPFVIFALMQKSTSIASFGMATIGALLAFMFYNYHPAKIFMGDVGSLGLGGLLAAMAILTAQELLLVLIGVMFVIETLSVIIQVGYFKLTKKRFFRMAPIHHHFEMLGWSEQQVVLAFWFGGFIAGVIGVLIGVM